MREGRGDLFTGWLMAWLQRGVCWALGALSRARAPLLHRGELSSELRGIVVAVTVLRVQKIVQGGLEE
jgi:hypothetical protein